jgi:hypothetical protein
MPTEEVVEMVQQQIYQVLLFIIQEVELVVDMDLQVEMVV